MQLMSRDSTGEILRNTWEVCQPYYVKAGAGLLTLVGVDLAIHGVDTSRLSPALVATDCIVEQRRRLRQAHATFQHKRENGMDERVAAGITHHGVLRRVFDYITTLDSDPMSCRVTPGDEKLLELAKQKAADLAI